METHYCWRCECKVPLLSESEWAILSPLADETINKVKDHRKLTGCSIKEAQLVVGNRLLEEFNRITGFNETNYLAIYHHRRSLFGKECGNCGFLLRTPRASYCVNCGQSAMKNGGA